MASVIAPVPDVTDRIEFPAGVLEISNVSGDVPLSEYCDFAARNNPRRGFLVVSKVLGRHMPAKPSDMNRSFRLASSKLPVDPDQLPGPVVFIGMAETAVCLGRGVFTSYKLRSGRRDVMYIHSTRQQLSADVLLEFAEPHSHAAAHLLYQPTDATLRDMLHRARSVVLVDDECSTGTTFANLAVALKERIPTIERIDTVVLADWSRPAWLSAMPVPARSHSVLQGELAWTPYRHFTQNQSVEAMKVSALGHLDKDPGHGRFGLTKTVNFAMAGHLDAARIMLRPASKVLVLGTGEFTYAPYVLALLLEQGGHDVSVQAITRSPIHLGGAIGHKLQLTDNYEAAVPNFIYNVRPGQYDQVFICHETPEGSIDPALVSQLDATCLYMGAPR